MYCDIPILDRCCFCLPLRKGILIIAYINLLLCTFMVGLYSVGVHHNVFMFTVYHGTSDAVPKEAVIGLYCCEIVFTALLIYGAHKELLQPVMSYYYFSIATLVAGLVLQIVDFMRFSGPYFYIGLLLELMPLLFCSTFLQLYLLLLIRSMMKRLERGTGPHTYENQLEQIVFEGKTEPNGGVYNNTVCTPSGDNQ